jgi:hypothetical protein
MVVASPAWPEAFTQLQQVVKSTSIRIFGATSCISVCIFKTYCGDGSRVALHYHSRYHAYKILETHAAALSSLDLYHLIEGLLYCIALSATVLL